MNESICVYCEHFKDVAPSCSRTPMWRCELGTKARVTLDVCEDYKDDGRGYDNTTYKKEVV